MRTQTLALAIKRAIEAAKDGPRVAAVARIKRAYVKKGETWYVTLKGFMDADSDMFAQILLVTPDGRLWECFNPVSLTVAEREIVYG